MALVVAALPLVALLEEGLAVDCGDASGEHTAGLQARAARRSSGKVVCWPCRLGCSRRDRLACPRKWPVWASREAECGALACAALLSVNFTAAE